MWDPHLVQHVVVREHEPHIVDRLRPRVLQRDVDAEQRPKPLHLRIEPKCRAGGVGERGLPVGDDLDVGARSVETQLAEVSLEYAVHLGGVLALALCLLDVELGLLGHLPGHARG